MAVSHTCKTAYKDWAVHWPEWACRSALSNLMLAEACVPDWMHSSTGNLIESRHLMSKNAW